jgi:hypothetical protein
MGRTYEAKSKKAKGNGGSDFDVNFAGADILGCLMKAVGEHSKELEKFHKPLVKLGIDHPCTRYKMPKKDCIRAAKKLKALKDEKLEETFEKCKQWFESGSTVDTLKEFAAEWAKFLETCGGYEVPG